MHTSNNIFCRSNAYRTTFNNNFNTNNGTEAKNRAFKHKYLAHRADLQLSTLIDVIVKEVIVDEERDYFALNVMARGRRHPRTLAPDYMRNYTPHAKKILVMNLVAARLLGPEKGQRTENDGIFTVNSHTVSMLQGTCSCPYVSSRSLPISRAPITAHIHLGICSRCLLHSAQMVLPQ